MDKTAADIEAEAFFAQFVDPSQETVARLTAEASVPGDLAAILAEVRASRVARRMDGRYPEGRARQEERRTVREVKARHDAFRARQVREAAAAAFWARVTDPANRDEVAAEAREAFLATYRSLLGGRDQSPVSQEEAARIGTLSRLREAGKAARRAARAVTREQRRRSQILRTEVHPAGMTAERALQIALTVYDGSPHPDW